MAKTIFTYEESPYHPNLYTIRIKCEDFYLNYTSGSYNIICARLLNLSYASYLRFCRDVLGAIIIGKNCIYPVAYFKKGENLFGLIKLLNAQANLILFEQEHPDYDKHEEEIKKYKSKFQVRTNDSNN